MKIEEQPQSISDKETKDVEKEMHMTGRAMRVDETSEEYKKERERSWAKQKLKAENPETPEIEEQFKSSFETTVSSEAVKVYDKSGKIVFSGTPEQMVVFWKNKDYGTIENMGGILNSEGESIFRFGPVSGRGFTDREKIDELFLKLENRVVIENQEIEDQIKLRDLRQKLGLEAQKQEQATSSLENKSVHSEKEEYSEKEEIFKEQVKDFLEIALKDKETKRLMDKYRNTKFRGEPEELFKKRQSLSDVEMFAKMPSSMYELIHKSGMNYQEVVNGINIQNKEEFIKNFNDEISDRLVDVVSQSSKVRHITEQELIQGGQPDQAAGFVWFKGNSPKPKDAREVRFYINASPDGTTQTAEYLSKLSDQLDQHGLRLQFKFRKDIVEYDRTDTCVAYLYMPKAETAEQKVNSDLWLAKVKEAMAKIPKEAIRNKNSFFTEKIEEGISFAEDSREAEGKKGESYTSQITKVIGESSGELAKQFKDLTPEAIEQITLKTVKKLKQMNYF
jgi:hypothetical protein